MSLRRMVKPRCREIELVVLPDLYLRIQHNHHTVKGLGDLLPLLKSERGVKIDASSLQLLRRPHQKPARLRSQEGTQKRP